MDVGLPAVKVALHRWFDRHDGQMDIAAGMIQALGRRISPRVACGWFAWHDWRDGRCAWCECGIWRAQWAQSPEVVAKISDVAEWPPTDHDEPERTGGQG